MTSGLVRSVSDAIDSSGRWLPLIPSYYSWFVRLGKPSRALFSTRTPTETHPLLIWFLLKVEHIAARARGLLYASTYIAIPRLPSLLRSGLLSAGNHAIVLVRQFVSSALWSSLLYQSYSAYSIYTIDLMVQLWVDSPSLILFFGVSDWNLRKFYDFIMKSSSSSLETSEQSTELTSQHLLSELSPSLVFLVSLDWSLPFSSLVASSEWRILLSKASQLQQPATRRWKSLCKKDNARCVLLVRSMFQFHLCKLWKFQLELKRRMFFASKRVKAIEIVLL